MITIEERWNELPIPERIEIAKAAGVEGKTGSATWESMHHLDREAISKWAAPKPELREFVVLNYNPSKKYQWSMHAKGCRDIGRELKGIGTDSGFPAIDPSEIQAETWEQAADHWIDEELRELGWSIDAIRINPCCESSKGKAKSDAREGKGWPPSRPAYKQLDFDGLGPEAIEKAAKAIQEFNHSLTAPPTPAVQHARDYLLWVGYQSYQTIRSFVEEAERLGVSRRISRVPRDLVLGRSKVFLAHDEGETGDAVIFGYFIPSSIEIIVYREGENGVPDGLKGIATPVTVEAASREEGRGCGYREDIGSIYLISGEMTEIRPHKDYNLIIDPGAHRFRGIKKVDGNKILKGREKKAPSEAHRIPRSKQLKRESGEAWSEEDKKILVELLGKFRPWRALREMHKITGRSINAVAYQYNKIREAAKTEEKNK